MDNQQIRDDILKTMRIRIRQGEAIAKREWTGFLNDKNTAPALQELAHNDELFGKFFATLSRHFGETGLSDHDLIHIKREQNRRKWEELKAEHSFDATGFAAELLLKYI